MKNAVKLLALITLGISNLSAASVADKSYLEENALIAKGGGHHGGHHGGHGHHHGHHHNHNHHNHNHHHNHYHNHNHHYHNHNHHHVWAHGNHGFHNWYWNGGTGGVWGTSPGYLYDPNYYYNVNGTPSVTHLYNNETPLQNLVPTTEGAPGQTNFINNIEIEAENAAEKVVSHTED